MNPFHEEGERGHADMVDRVCCFLIIRFADIRCCSQQGYPIAEGVSAVGWLPRGWLECDESNDRQEPTAGTDEKCSLLPHAQTLPQPHHPNHDFLEKVAQSSSCVCPKTLDGTKERMNPANGDLGC